MKVYSGEEEALTEAKKIIEGLNSIVSLLTILFIDFLTVLEAVNCQLGNKTVPVKELVRTDVTVALATSITLIENYKVFVPILQKETTENFNVIFLFFNSMLLNKV